MIKLGGEVGKACKGQRIFTFPSQNPIPQHWLRSQGRGSLHFPEQSRYTETADLPRYFSASFSSAANSCSSSLLFLQNSDWGREKPKLKTGLTEQTRKGRLPGERRLPENVASSSINVQLQWSYHPASSGPN